MLAAEENPAVWQEKDEKGAAVLYEDAELAIVDKPSGLALHPHTLTRHVPDLEPARGDAFHFVGKMESEMSGVFPIAKSLPCARALESQYSGGSVVLEVGGIVEGVPDEDSWEIDLPLGPDERKSGRRVVNREHGDPAVTRVEVRERYDGFAEVAAFPMTHRTHQVRAHLAASGYPPAVDAIYGGRAEVELSDLKRHYVKKVGRHEKPILTRVSLHARAIGLVSPAKGAVRVESPWPPSSPACAPRSSATALLDPNDRRHQRSAQPSDPQSSVKLKQRPADFRVLELLKEGFPAAPALTTFIG